ncbi:L,D-transpeptidase [Synechococcus sp. ATX 2A4]|uniref:L,D-transpeptidase n=1 Tax=Synechococcus sp. ATX 2A4 TaxID=2823727 RepID=UPI0020CFD5DC|nr:L,D-transpeptidase [Synechococcus sp. ATX 2A4]MCP9883963.1 L,D-transpeptidase [Synechococcus sp. ATX 2A4]
MVLPHLRSSGACTGALVIGLCGATLLAGTAALALPSANSAGPASSAPSTATPEAVPAPADAAPDATTPTTTAPGAAPPATTAPTTATPAAAPAVRPVVASRIVLRLGKRDIRLERGGKVYGPWPVAIGDARTPTPTGTFQVTNKVVNPVYASTRTGKVTGTVGPNGPLGDRWLGFKTAGPNQFGIHGTPSAWAWTVSSRAAVTNGCVRMFHEHVRKLFDLVDVGTPVVITR